MNKTNNNQLSMIDYLYVKASKAYMLNLGLPDPYVRNIWINNYIRNELEKMELKKSSITSN